LCFNGGACAPVGAGCTCPDGYSHDFSFYHDDNCALPANLYLVNLVVCAVIVAVCAARLEFSVRTTKKGSSVRDLHYANLCFHATCLGLAAGTFVESGWYYIASAFFLALIPPFCYFVYLNLKIVVLPILGLFPDLQVRFRLGLKILIPLFASAPTALMIAMLVTCGDDSLAAYNRFANGLFLQLAGYFFVLLGLAEAGIRYLYKLLANSGVKRQDGSTVEALLRKINGIRTAIRYGCGLVFVLAALFPVVHMSLGSFPYAFVFIFFCFSIVFPVCTTLVTLAFAKRTDLKTKTTQDQPSSPRSASKTNKSKSSDPTTGPSRTGPIGLSRFKPQKQPFNHESVASKDLVSVNNVSTVDDHVLEPGSSSTPHRSRFWGRLAMQMSSLSPNALATQRISAENPAFMPPSHASRVMESADSGLPDVEP